MSYSFNGTTQYLSLARGIIPTGPIAISAWIRTSTVAADQTVFRCKQDSSVHLYGLSIQSGVNRINWQIRQNGGNNVVVVAANNSVIVNRWQHLFVYSNTSTDHGQFISGGSQVTDATASLPASLNETGVGANGDGSSFFSGQLAEFALWKISSAGRMQALARMLASGKSAAQPELRRGLVSYLPMRSDGLLRNQFSGLRDFCGIKWTVNANPAPSNLHPLIDYPTEMLSEFEEDDYVTPAAGGTTVGRLLRGLFEGGTLVGGRLVG